MKFVDWVDRVWKAFPEALRTGSVWEQHNGINVHSRSLYLALNFDIYVMPRDKISRVRKAIDQALSELTAIGLLVPTDHEETPRLLPSSEGNSLIIQGLGPACVDPRLTLSDQEENFLQVVCTGSPTSVESDSYVLLTLVEADVVYARLGWDWNPQSRIDALWLIEMLASKGLLKRTLSYMCMPTYKAFCQVEGVHGAEEGEGAVGKVSRGLLSYHVL